MSRTAAVALGLLAVGCGGSGIPRIGPEDLHKPVLAGMAPRTLKLVVLEGRVPPPEGSKETLERVRTSVAGALTAGGIKVLADSPNTLQVRVSPPDPHNGVEVEAQSGCVMIETRLDMPDGAAATAGATGCFEWRHAFGFSMGTDPTKAFKTALNGALRQLDKQLVPLKPSPRQ